MVARLLVLAEIEKQASNFPCCLKHKKSQLTALKKFPDMTWGRGPKAELGNHQTP